jgi:hypothetical protein
MENVSAAVALKNAIQQLEVEQAISGQLLKEQLYFTYENLKPANILRNTVREVITSPHLVDDILGMAVGLVTGFASKKIVIGASGSLIRKLLGSITQLGITTVVSQHPEAIKSIGQYIFQRIFSKKDKGLKSEFGLPTSVLSSIK